MAPDAMEVMLCLHDTEAVSLQLIIRTGLHHTGLKHPHLYACESGQIASFLHLN